MRDGYNTARVQLIQDDAIPPDEFDGLFYFHDLFCFKFVLDVYQLNRNTYNRVRNWFDQLDAYRRTLISRQLEGYPPCDDLTHDSSKYLYLFIDCRELSNFYSSIS
jgi:hypothetical protein